MNKSQKKKIGNERLVLPAIISDKEVFADMTKPERALLYVSINNKIIEDKFRRGQSSYKKMLFDPVENLSKPLLEGKRKNKQLWIYLVEVFEECLYEHLAISIDYFQEKHKGYTIDITKAADRISSLQSSIAKYTPKVASNE